jgi:two-component system nitrogen regulation sensor histidine kinase NtrY
VPIQSPLEEGVEGGEGLVRVTWAVDPAVRLRHERLGEIARDLGAVEVKGARGEGSMVERDEVRRALIAALGVASSLVLFVAILAGILIARRTTRKLSDLSAVMRRVASGDLSVRAPRLGRDELGQLAGSFNTMLDELEHTRRRVAYLQRVGAWQEMARRIAHEIKNPLTPIQLAAQQLREKDPGTDPAFSKLLRESVEIVEDEVEALRRMVTSFSQFAKVPEVALEPVSLERILSEFERAYAHVDAELEVVLDADLEVLGDRQLLKQVLVNLVENAALSAREVGVAPKIRVSGDQIGHVACLVVEDNGPGVAIERRELVFEPYETTREHGTGLGLAIVKKIVLDHGGEVCVAASERLGGARFEVRLRLA